MTIRICCVVLCLLLSACQDEPVRELHGRTMGTTWSVQFVPGSQQDVSEVGSIVAAELDRVDSEMSTWRGDTAISRYNRADAGSWHELPEAFAEVLAAAIEVARETGGAFDPTIGPLVNLWGFGPEGRRELRPDLDALAGVAAAVGWQRLQLDAEGRLLQPGGVQLDFSAIAKGHAVDRIARRLDAAGIGSYLVEVGGELFARGRRPDGRFWRIAIESPRDAEAAPLATLELDGRAVATSGDYRNHYEHEGRRYSHLIDPRHAQPVDHALVSVAVVHKSCMWADALATALLVLGPEQGLAHAEAHGLAVLLLINEDGGSSSRSSSAFRALPGYPAMKAP